MKRVLAILPLLAATACGGGDAGGGDAHAPGHGDPTASGTAAGRVVEMKATDALRFDPSTVASRPGETVTFRITNTGQARHEFVIGDDHYHAEHAKHMGSGSPSAHAGHDGRGGNATDLPPGSTTEITFTMPGKAPRFACYVDRHNEAGMTGTITYS